MSEYCGEVVAVCHVDDVILFREMMSMLWQNDGRGVSSEIRLLTFDLGMPTSTFRGVCFISIYPIRHLTALPPVSSWYILTPLSDQHKQLSVMAQSEVEILIVSIGSFVLSGGFVDRALS